MNGARPDCWVLIVILGLFQMRNDEDEFFVRPTESQFQHNWILELNAVFACLFNANLFFVPQICNPATQPCIHAQRHRRAARRPGQHL